jgi:uncharacterized repeat protein (TIGR01451 family)
MNQRFGQFGEKRFKAKFIFTIFACLAIVFLSKNALAGSGCVGWYSTNASGEISYFNPQTNAYALLNTYTSANINAGAVQPSTGDIFFVNRATNKLVVYDKTANTFTTLSGTLSTSLGAIVGATFNNSGTLYVMYDEFKMITVNPATGAQTGSTITYTGVPGDGASPNGTNGDIAFDASGQMWMVGNSGASTFRLYKISISGTAATATAFSPNITGFSGSIAGLTIAAGSGNFYVTTATATYQINSSSGATISLVGDGANDLAGCSVTPDAPTISKSFTAATAATVPATSTLTLTIGNTNLTEDYLLTNLTDTLPTGMLVAAPNNLSGTCKNVTGNTVTAVAATNTITFSSGGKIPIGGCTIIANVSVLTAGTYTNTIAASNLKTLAGNNPSAGTAVFTVSSPPNISLTKTCSNPANCESAVQLSGTELTYTISFANSGGQAAANFSIIDPNPAIATLKLNNNTDFKVGSVSSSLGTSGLTATVTYSNNGGASFLYTPVSAGGGAAAGYDRNVTHIRWTFTGTLSQISPGNAGNVSFVVLIR